MNGKNCWLLEFNRKKPAAKSARDKYHIGIQITKDNFQIKNLRFVS